MLSELSAHETTLMLKLAVFLNWIEFGILPIPN
jgi:hypothetical protein